MEGQLTKITQSVTSDFATHLEAVAASGPRLLLAHIIAHIM